MFCDNKLFFCSLVLVCSLIASVDSGTIDVGFQTCQKPTPNFETCLAAAIEKGVKLLKSGSAVFKIPSIDPFKKKSLTIGAGTGAVHLTQYYTNLVITGFADLKVNSSHWNMAKKILKFTSLHPKVEQLADYDINGKLLVLPVQGNGDCRLTLENVVVDHTIQFEVVKKNNEEYLNVKAYSIALTPSHASYNFNNLFNGNKVLGDNINKIINDEWQTIYLDVKDGYEKGYGSEFQKWTKNIFDRVPIKDMFPN